MGGIIGWLLGSGSLNDSDDAGSPLLTLGWGDWLASEWLLLLGWTIATRTAPYSVVNWRLADSRPVYRIPDERPVYVVLK